MKLTDVYKQQYPNANGQPAKAPAAAAEGRSGHKHSSKKRHKKSPGTLSVMFELCSDEDEAAGNQQQQGNNGGWKQEMSKWYAEQQQWDSERARQRSAVATSAGLVSNCAIQKQQQQCHPWLAGASPNGTPLRPYSSIADGNISPLAAASTKPEVGHGSFARLAAVMPPLNSACTERVPATPEDELRNMLQPTCYGAAAADPAGSLAAPTAVTSAAGGGAEAAQQAVQQIGAAAWQPLQPRFFTSFAEPRQPARISGTILQLEGFHLSGGDLAAAAAEHGPVQQAPQPASAVAPSTAVALDGQAGGDRAPSTAYETPAAGARRPHHQPTVTPQSMPSDGTLCAALDSFERKWGRLEAPPAAATAATPGNAAAAVGAGVPRSPRRAQPNVDAVVAVAAAAAQSPRKGKDKLPPEASRRLGQLPLVKSPTKVTAVKPGKAAALQLTSAYQQLHRAQQSCTQQQQQQQQQQAALPQPQQQQPPAQPLQVPPPQQAHRQVQDHQSTVAPAPAPQQPAASSCTGFAVRLLEQMVASPPEPAGAAIAGPPEWRERRDDVHMSNHLMAAPLQQQQQQLTAPELEQRQPLLNGVTVPLRDEQLLGAPEQRQATVREVAWGAAAAVALQAQPVGQRPTMTAAWAQFNVHQGPPAADSNGAQPPPPAAACRAPNAADFISSTAVRPAEPSRGLHTAGEAAQDSPPVPADGAVPGPGPASAGRTSPYVARQLYFTPLGAQRPPAPQDGADPAGDPMQVDQVAGVRVDGQPPDVPGGVQDHRGEQGAELSDSDTDSDSSSLDINGMRPYETADQQYMRRLQKEAIQLYGAPPPLGPIRDPDGSYSRKIASYLPPKVVEAYRQRKMTYDLYEWQAECLNKPGVLHGLRNLVYCAPTSGGKGMVAEMLMLRRVLTSGMPAMLVLPFVALCHEKAAQLEALMKPMGRSVRRLYGSQGAGGTIIQHDTGVLVCTIEKANNTVNKMLEEGSLHQICCVVIDELHMVGDDDRGYLLELMLTKLRHACMGDPVDPDSMCPTMQIIGMSATMPNVDCVAAWLDAELYVTTFRPVPLQQYLLMGDELQDENGGLVRRLQPPADWPKAEPVDKMTALLAKETTDGGHSVLVFCCSRAQCAVQAMLLAKLLNIKPRDSVMALADVVGGSPAQSSPATWLATELARLPGKPDEGLKFTMARGVGYHHAGLSREERELVEDAYKVGAISVLCATSTLAAGVNLPARRVIFRHPYKGNQNRPIDATSYRQMAGRAGRAGLDSMGESILIVLVRQQRELLLSLMRNEATPIASCLSEDKHGMKRAVLEVVASGAVRSSDDVESFVRATLLNATAGFDAVKASTLAAIEYLQGKGFCSWDRTGRVWKPTLLGQAAMASGMTPGQALDIAGDLDRARQMFVLANDLHLTYLVTPIQPKLDNIDSNKLQQLFLSSKVTELDWRVADCVGLRRQYVQHRAFGKSKKEDDERILERFYKALIVRDLVMEMDESAVTAKYGVQLAWLEMLKDSAGKFAGMMNQFCDRLGYSDLEALLKQFQTRVTIGVKSDVVALTEIQGVRATRARALFKAGLKTPEAVAASPLELIIEILQSVPGRGDPTRTARKIHQSAKDLVLSRAADQLAQARDIQRVLRGEDVSITPPAEADEQLALPDLCRRPPPPPKDKKQRKAERQARRAAEREEVDREMQRRADDLAAYNARMQIDAPGEVQHDHPPLQHPVAAAAAGDPADAITAAAQRPAPSGTSLLALQTASTAHPQPPTSTSADGRTAPGNIADGAGGHASSTGVGAGNPGPGVPPSSSDAAAAVISPEPAHLNKRRKTMRDIGHPQLQQERQHMSDLTNIADSPPRLPAASAQPPAPHQAANQGPPQHQQHQQHQQQPQPQTRRHRPPSSRSGGAATSASVSAVTAAAAPGPQHVLHQASNRPAGSLHLNQPPQELQHDQRRPQTSYQAGGAAPGLGLPPPPQSRNMQPPQPTHTDRPPPPPPNGWPTASSRQSHPPPSVPPPAQHLQQQQQQQQQPHPPQQLQNYKPSKPPDETGVVYVRDAAVMQHVVNKIKVMGRFGFAVDIPAHRRCSSNNSLQMDESLQLPDMRQQGAAAAQRDAGRRALAGLACSIHNGAAFYIPLNDDTQPQVLDMVRELLADRALTKITFGLKQQYAALSAWSRARTGGGGSSGGGGPPDAPLLLDLQGPTFDIRLAAWVLSSEDSKVHEKHTGSTGKKSVTGAVWELTKDVTLDSATHDTLRPFSGSIGSNDRTDTCRRAALSRLAAEQLYVLLRHDGCLPALEDIEMPLVRVLWRMEEVGVAVDPAILEAQRLPLNKRLKQLEQLVRKRSGFIFDIKTNSEVAYILFDKARLGLVAPPEAKQTKNGKPSTSEPVLSKMLDQHPVVRHILEYRKLAKLEKILETMQQFASNSPTVVQLPNGRSIARLHGTITQTCTATGRLSMDEPNLQTVPRPHEYELPDSIGTPTPPPPRQQHTYSSPEEEEEDAQEAALTARVMEQSNIRLAFVAPPGYCLMSADYNQIELRIMAHFSGDVGLCALLSDRRQDAFLRLAAEWQRIPQEHVTPVQRNYAKQLAYGMLYGKGAPALADDLNVSVKEAKQLLDSFHRSLPGVNKWLLNIVRGAQRDRYVKTLAGRKRLLPGIASSNSSDRASAERQAVNAVCQGSAADLVKAAMVELDRRIEGTELGQACRMVLQIHDELIFEVREDCVSSVAADIRQVLEHTTQLNVPLPVKIHVGPSWGELKQLT